MLTQNQEFWLGLLCEEEWQRVCQSRSDKYVERWTGPKAEKAAKNNLKSFRAGRTTVRVGRQNLSFADNLDKALRVAQGHAEGLKRPLHPKVLPYRLFGKGPKPYGQRARIIREAQAFALKHYAVAVSPGKVEKLWKAYRSLLAELRTNYAPLESF